MPFLIDPTALYCKKLPYESGDPSNVFCGTQSQWDAMSEIQRLQYDGAQIINEDCVIFGKEGK